MFFLSFKNGRHIRIKARIDEKCLTSAESKATYERILEYVLEHTGLNVSHLYIFQAKQEYGTIERGIHLAEIRKRQVALMPYLRSKHKGSETLRDKSTEYKRTSI